MIKELKANFKLHGMYFLYKKRGRKEHQNELKNKMAISVVKHG